MVLLLLVQLQTPLQNLLPLPTAPLGNLTNLCLSFVDESNIKGFLLAIDTLHQKTQSIINNLQYAPALEYLTWHHVYLNFRDMEDLHISPPILKQLTLKPIHLSYQFLDLEQEDGLTDQMENLCQNSSLSELCLDFREPDFH